MQYSLSAKASLFSAMLMVGTLTGCQALDEMEADGYRQECEKLGIHPGSASFDECMLQQQAISEDSTQRSLDRIERENEHKHKHKH